MENEFPKLGEVDKDFTFYKTQESDTSGSLYLSGRNEVESRDNESQIPNPILDLSGSTIPNSSGSMELQ